MNKTSHFQKLYKHISRLNQLSWERYLSILLLLYIIVAGLFIVLNTSIRITKVPFIWLVLITLLTACLIFLHKIYMIYIKKEKELFKSRADHYFLLSLSGFALVICFLGYYWELFQLKQYGHIFETKLIYLVHTSDSRFSMTLEDMAVWISENSVFVMIGMLTTLTIAFMWYFLENKLEYADRSLDQSTLID